MNVVELYDIFKQSTGITTDSRNIAANNIFFALKGTNFNGNLFAAEAIEKGALLVVADEQHFAPNPKIAIVENALQTMQQLALFHRKKFKGKVIALTGSNGKTTTKELMAAVLATTYKTQATKGNLNNHIGIPLTLLSMPESIDFAIVEMGANHQQEIHSYCQYVEPDFGLVTNVGLAHLEGFGGFEGVVKGKTELYRYLAANGGKVFVNTDNDILLHQAKEAGFIASNLITYGTAAPAFCEGKLQEGTFLTLAAAGETIHTNLVGNYNFENALAACCTGKYFGVEFPKIKAALENYVPTNNRSQKIEQNGNTIILDCYNANPSSMKAAIESFANTAAQPRIAILGGMKEMGGSSARVHEEIAALAQAQQLEQVIFVGSEFEAANFGLKFLTTEAAINWLKAHPFSGANILVKGSRAYKLETLFL
ncbi:MAG: UDP-N-acetylmuramoyl-tripeptide--D-alanyl-D-alanine ligase [Chitinophagales bacterium]